MWQTGLKILAVYLVRKYMNQAKDHIKNDSNEEFDSVKHKMAVLLERRASLYRKNFNDEVTRICNSLLGLMVMLLSAALAGLTAIMWIFAVVWNSPQRDTILGLTMLVPLLACVAIFAIIRHSWKKEPLFDKTMLQIESDWQAFRYGLDGTADISDEANN